jgi:hypothetical protein
LYNGNADAQTLGAHPASGNGLFPITGETATRDNQVNAAPPDFLRTNVVLAQLRPMWR